MNILLAIAVMIIIIIASYLADRKYPTKRIFIIPCGIILLCFVAVYSSLVIPSSSNSIYRATFGYFKWTTLFYNMVQWL